MLPDGAHLRGVETAAASGVALGEQFGDGSDGPLRRAFGDQADAASRLVLARAPDAQVQVQRHRVPLAGHDRGAFAAGAGRAVHLGQQHGALRGHAGAGSFLQAARDPDVLDRQRGVGHAVARTVDARSRLMFQLALQDDLRVVGQSVVEDQ